MKISEQIVDMPLHELNLKMYGSVNIGPLRKLFIFVVNYLICTSLTYI